MKRQLICVFFLSIALLMGCAKEQQTFEDYFHNKMKEMHKGEKNYSYSLIHKEMNVVHQDDAIAIFKEQNQQGEQIFIAYFTKENDKWNWKQTRGAEWGTPVKWSAMNQVPYIYSGSLKGNSVSEVYAGGKLAKIITVQGDKRFWFAISDVKDVEVKVVKKDGTQEMMEEIDKQLLKD